MDLVFCGTPLFAVPTLERLVDAGFRVKLVVTQPDRASGRGMELTASPVKRSALERGLPIVQPDKIKSNESSALFWKSSSLRQSSSSAMAGSFPSG